MRNFKDIQGTPPSMVTLVQSLVKGIPDQPVAERAMLAVLEHFYLLGQLHATQDALKNGAPK